MRIRAAETPTDYQAVVHILDRVSSVRLTPEEVEYGVTSEPGSILLVAELDGVDVASGLGKRSTIAGAQYTMIRVLLEARRQGIGQALFEALSAHGRGQALEDAWGRVQGEDTDSLAFAERRGFSEFSREVESILTLAPLEPAPPPPGIEITTLGARPDLDEACHRVDLEAVPDIPAAESEARPLDWWRGYLVDGPGALPHLLTIALADGEVVGYSSLLALAGQPGTLENQLTGVKRAWRGRGIAMALKREQARLAHEAGFERISTYNDEVNAPMRAVNTRLGFVPQPPSIMVRGPFAPAR
jgi:mycothiol synthase